MEKQDYAKPFYTLDQQAELLISRGLLGDKEEIKKRLASVGYYRLSAYWYPYRQWDESGKRISQLLPGTSISQVWNHYVFDRRLRLLLFDAIERIEIAIRSRLAYRLAEATGPFGYGQLLSESSLKRVKINDHFRKNHTFVEHFSQKYRGDMLPVWMVVGLMEFGTLTELLHASGPDIKKAVSADIGVSPAVFLSWCEHLRVVRNACAHHARVWNNIWGVSPKIPRTEREWRMQYADKAHKWINDRNSPEVSFVRNKTGVSLMICRIIMRKVAKTSEWKKRVDNLFGNFQKKGINFESMGLPGHWQDHPLWK